MMRKQGVVFLFTVFVMLSVFIAGCDKPLLYSKWRKHEVSIDGDFDDWQDDLTYYDERTRVNMGVLNDDDFLYLCLISHNRSMAQQLMRSGFTVWFDSKGGSKKIFGIRFPTGMQSSDRPPITPGDMGKHPDEKDSKEGREEFQQPWQEVEIIGPDQKERHITTLEAAEKDGIYAGIGQAKGYFVYELKIPLKENDKYPYAIGINRNTPVGIGFAISRSMAGRRGMMEMPGRGSMQMFNGNMPGGSGFPGGGGLPGRGGGPGGMGRMPSPEEEQFQLWIRVLLPSKDENE